MKAMNIPFDQKSRVYSEHVINGFIINGIFK